MDSLVQVSPIGDTARPPPQRRHRPLIAGGLGVLALLALGYAAYQVTHTAPAPSWRLGAITHGPITAAVIASGTVNPVINVQVGSQVSGQVKALYADFNSKVTTGQLIARIDPALFETQVAQAEADLAVAQAAVGVQLATVARADADLASARAQLDSLRAQSSKAQVASEDAARIADRARRLAQTGTGSIADRDTTQATADQAAAQVTTALAQENVQRANIASAEAALGVARANLTSAQAQIASKQAALDNARVNLDHTAIRAPVDGTVVLRNVDVGQTVVASLQSPLIFTIAQDLRQMQVDASVDEADVGGVKPGQAANFTVDAYPGRMFQGQVQQVRIAPQVVQNVVTYDVVVSAPNPDLALLPGLTAMVRLVVDHRDDALLVPNAALRYRPADAAGPPLAPGTATAWVPNPDGHPRPVTLHTGISDGSVTELRETASTTGNPPTGSSPTGSSPSIASTGGAPPAALQAGSAVIIGDAPTAKGGPPSSPGMSGGPRF